MTPEHRLSFFDPAHAKVGATVTFGAAQALDNVLDWLETSPRDA